MGKGAYDQMAQRNYWRAYARAACDRYDRLDKLVDDEGARALFVGALSKVREACAGSCVDALPVLSLVVGHAGSLSDVLAVADAITKLDKKGDGTCAALLSALASAHRR